MTDIEQVPTVVIGGGQAGLSTGYFLARHGLRFVILEAYQRVGDTWRERWDSLRLFTPARFDGLAGMPFPAPPRSFPTKNAMADYLESYAERFALPVRTGVSVRRLSRNGTRYVVTTADRTIEAENVVVAMATFQRPRTPAFAAELDAGIAQLHSSAYRNISQLSPGGVLVVGAGNSGSEIALEAARAGHRTWMAGRDTGHVPFRIERPLGRLLLPFVFRVIFHRLLTVDTPLGRSGTAEDRLAGRSADPGQAAGPREGRCGAGGTRGGCARRPSAPGIGPGAGRGERGLVHGLRSRVHLDRPPRPGRAGRAEARARNRSDFTGAVFRGPAFSLRAVVHHDPRGGTGCQRVADAIARRSGALSAAS